MDEFGNYAPDGAGPATLDASEQSAAVRSVSVPVDLDPAIDAMESGIERTDLGNGRTELRVRRGTRPAPKPAPADPDESAYEKSQRLARQIKACVFWGLIGVSVFVLGASLFYVSVRRTQIREDNLAFGSNIVVPKSRPVWSETQARGVSRMRCRPIQPHEFASGRADEGYLLTDLYRSLCASLRKTNTGDLVPGAAVELGPSVHRCVIAKTNYSEDQSGCEVWINPVHKQPWYSWPSTRPAGWIHPMCPSVPVVKQMPTFAHILYQNATGDSREVVVYEDSGIAILFAMALSEGDVPC